MLESQLDRFLDHVQLPVDMTGEIIEGLCWNWIGHTLHGYGRFNLDGRPSYAHRVIYAHCYGEVSDGSHVHHSCNNKSCVNPEHLKAVSASDHQSLHKKTHCKRGHELTEDNVRYTYRGKYELRSCKTCTREYLKERWRHERAKKLDNESALMNQLSERLLTTEKISTLLDKRQKP